MPIMIPAEIHDSVKGSEKTIFEIFKSSAKRNWVVLHGITISSCDSNSLPDFVILIPDLVSVICLKVVESDTDEPSTDQIEEALNQAEESMNTLSDCNHPPPFFGCAAVFIGDKEFKVKLPDELNVRSSNNLDAILEGYAIDMTSELWESWETMTPRPLGMYTFPMGGSTRKTGSITK